MACNQAPRDHSTAGFGNEAGLGQGSAVQTHPFCLLCPGEGSGTHCVDRYNSSNYIFWLEKVELQAKIGPGEHELERKNLITQQSPVNTVPQV